MTNLFPNPTVNNLTQTQYDKLNAEWAAYSAELDPQTEWYYMAAEEFVNATKIRHR